MSKLLVVLHSLGVQLNRWGGKFDRLPAVRAGKLLLKSMTQADSRLCAWAYSVDVRGASTRWIDSEYWRERLQSPNYVLPALQTTMQKRRNTCETSRPQPRKYINPLLLASMYKVPVCTKCLWWRVGSVEHTRRQWVRLASRWRLPD